jgi:hypothetical protein
MLSTYGKVFPLILNHKFTNSTGLMNPSIYNDNDKLICIIRNTNYVLYHSEKKIFNHQYGPLQYVHPEHDERLITTNFLCELNEEYDIVNFSLINTSNLDKSPQWGFVGLEDARLIKWNKKFYITGVRRDTTENGQGRMELSEIDMNSSIEISRVRIPSPPDDLSYCEKNWMPILDRPFEYIKWCSPTEIVKFENGISTFTKKSTSFFSEIANSRGGSQVIPFIINDNTYYFTIIHEIHNCPNELNQKDGIYYHRILLWDSDFNIIKYSKLFSFMNGLIEFCCGACIYHDNVLITFGFQDNAAFLLEINLSVFLNLVFNNVDI